jgi:hypothetical protein
MIILAANYFRDRCYDLKKIFAKNFGEKIGVFYIGNTATFCKIGIIPLVFMKIGENRRKLRL